MLEPAEIALDNARLRFELWRQRAEAAVQESESRLQAIFDGVEAGILVIDAETHRIVDANPMALDLIGLSRDRVAGAECHKFVCPADRGRCPVTDLGQSVNNSERVLVTATGEARSIIKTVRRVVIAGRPHLLESFVDITERKRAEEALREAEGRFRLLFESIPLPTYLIDLDTLQYLEVNDAAVAHTGYSREELLKMRLSDILPPEEAVQVAARLQALRTHTSHRDKGRHLLPDGRIVDVEVDAHVLEVNGRKVLLSVVPDITERKRAERAFEERTTYLNTLIEVSPVGIAVLDTQGRIQMSNPAFDRLFLYSRQEMLGANLDELVIPGELLTDGKALTQQAIRGASVRATSRRLRKDGTSVDVEIYGVPLVIDGEARGLLALYQDITERERALAALRESEERYRLLFENTVAGVFGGTRDGQLLHCNPALATMLGFDSPQETMEHRVAEFYYSEDERRQFLERLSIEGSLSNYELRLRRKDGSPLWTIASVRCTPQEPAPSQVIEGTLVNITKRKLAEAEMAERHRLATLLAEVGLALTGAENMRQGLQLCAEVLVRDIGAAFARVWALNEADQILELEASAGIYTHIDGGHARVPVGKFKIGRIAESGEAHLTNTVLEDDWVGDPEWARREGMAAFAGYPLKVEDQMVGVVAAFARQPLTPATLQALASVSHHLAQFIERKKAEADLQRYAEDLESARAAQEEHSREQARLVEELARERDLLRALMDNLPDHIYFKDSQSRFLRANAAVARAFGLADPAQAIDKTDFDFFTAEHAQQAYNDEQEVIKTGQPVIGKEEKETWPDGRVTWASSSKMPLRDAEGNIIGTFGVSHDITERKRAEEAIRASEERYRDLFENATDMVYTSDLEHHITSLNRVAEQTSGYSREEAQGMPLEQLVEPRHWKRVTQARERLLAGDTTVTVELEIKTKDGRRMLVEVKPRLIYKGGKAVEVQGIARDITGRDVAEMELRHAQKLESVGRLASGIAHEINTPIQFVGDNTRFLRDAFQGLQVLFNKYQELRDAAAAGGVTAELLAEVRRVEEESDCAYSMAEIPNALVQTLEGVTRVATIVHAMKDFAHPESKEKAAADLNKAILSTLTVARNELKYVAEVETSLGELPPVVCNISDLNQVFLNLLVNAAHAIADLNHGTGQRGKIRVRTVCEGKTVLISIADTGCGIPEGIRGKIFDPFFTTKEVGRGTGQGLAISRSVVVDRHKGSLTFESEVGKGTTFYIRLPVESGEGSERTTTP
jgi:PAS domain S-box-containing protein